MKREKVIEWGVLALLVWTPLAAGSVYEWTILIIELTVFVMLGAYVLMKNHPRMDKLLAESLKWTKILFSGFIMVLLIQIIPWPRFLIKILSPGVYTFKEAFLAGFEKIKFMTFSIIPAHSLREGLEVLAYLGLGFLVIKNIRSKKQVIRMFSVIVGMGIFQAFYGMFELYSKNPRILFYKKVYGLDVVTGTFVNRNHLSGYLEMAVPLAIGLILARIHLFSGTGLSWRQKLQKLSERGLSVNLMISFGIVVMALGIVFSQSRSGVFLLVFTFLVMFELTVIYFRWSPRKQKWSKNFLKVVFLAITLLALYIGIEATIQRFAMDKLLSSGRPTVWTNTLGITRDFPLTGSGLGTFGEVYSAFEDKWVSKRHYTHAHNDFLEYTAELGVPGMIFLLGGILFMLVTAFLVWRERRNPEIKGLVLGGMVAVLNILLHSITDFNLHIPANMLGFTVILALAYVAVFSERKKAVKRTK